MRTGLRTWWRWVAVVCVALGADVATAASPCAGPVRALDLARWKATLRSARTGPEVLALLVEAGLLPRDGSQDPGAEKAEGLKARRAVTVHVDDFPVQLSPGGAPDRAIQVIVRAAVPAEAGAEGEGSYRLRVAGALRPAAQAWCELGLFVSEEDASDPTCSDFPGTTFAFEHLLAPDSQVIRTTRDEILCNPGGRDEGETRTVAYWALVDGRLARIFQGVVDARGYNVMGGLRTTKTRITPAGAFPKVLRVETTEACQPGMASMNFCVPEGEAGPNGPGYVDHSTATLVFDGKAYVAKTTATRRERTGAGEP